MTKVWVVMVDGERHIVELQCEYWFGGRKIYVDSELAVKERSGIFATDEEYRFKVGGKPAMLGVRGILIPRFELFVDGKRI